MSAPRAFAVVPDLFFQSRIAQTARTLGVPLEIVASVEALAAGLAAAPGALVLVDLAARGVDPFAAIEAARAGGAGRTVAFVSHVDETSRRRALEAGCDEVLARSAFTRDLPDILRNLPGS